MATPSADDSSPSSSGDEGRFPKSKPAVEDLLQELQRVSVAHAVTAAEFAAPFRAIKAARKRVTLCVAEECCAACQCLSGTRCGVCRIPAKIQGTVGRLIDWHGWYKQRVELHISAMNSHKICGETAQEIASDEAARLRVPATMLTGGAGEDADSEEAVERARAAVFRALDEKSPSAVVFRDDDKEFFGIIDHYDADADDPLPDFQEEDMMPEWLGPDFEDMWSG